MTALDRYLCDFNSGAQDDAAWADGSVKFLISCAVGVDRPPETMITSVRCVVTSADNSEVLVVEDPTAKHILPGGRREPGETIEETVRREVQEETGYGLGDIELIGVMHFKHLTRKPPDYSYPYPHFFHLVYTAHSTYYDDMAREKGGYEIGAEFWWIGWKNDDAQQTVKDYIVSASNS